MTAEASSSRTLPSAPGSAFSFETADLIEILEDLSTRFILNLPESESESIPRLCFQVEQAYWFYEDWVRDSQPNLPSYTLKRFSEIFFKVCPMLNKWSDKHERLFLEFMRYKSRVPVCGAIMINQTWDKCILVKGWKGNSWSFPKGKINQDEDKHICAIREVLEETGCNLIHLLKPGDGNFQETTIQDQRITLYFVPGVPEDFPFKTQTRKEIGAIEWFKLSDLPTWKKSKTTAAPKLAGKGKFYMILPFILELKKFVKANRPSKGSPQPTPTPTSAEPTPTDEEPPSEIEIDGTPLLVPESPAQLREAPVPLSELDELFARFLSSERDDPSRTSSAASNVESQVETEAADDDDEGTVMGASESAVGEKPPTRSILDDMFGALTMPSAVSQASPSTHFAPPPTHNHPPQGHGHPTQPQPHQSAQLLSLFSNLPPHQQIPPSHQQARPPMNANLLALLNPAVPSPALQNPSPVFHQHSSRPPPPMQQSMQQPFQQPQPQGYPQQPPPQQPVAPSPVAPNQKQTLLAMLSPPTQTRSIPAVNAAPSPAPPMSAAEKQKQRQMALLAMLGPSGVPGASSAAQNGSASARSTMLPPQHPQQPQQSMHHPSAPSPLVHPSQQMPIAQSPHASHPPPHHAANFHGGGPPFPDARRANPTNPISPRQQIPTAPRGFVPPPSRFPAFPPGGGPPPNGAHLPNPSFSNGHHLLNTLNGTPSFPPPHRNAPAPAPVVMQILQRERPPHHEERDPFTIDPSLARRQPPIEIQQPKPQVGMTNHAENLLGMLKGSGGGGGPAPGSRVADVRQPGYPSGSPALGGGR